MSYYNNVNYDLLSRIPLNSKRVLEIGCGDGSLGRAYKLRNPDVLYFGVELDAPSADAASKCLDGVWQGDVEKSKNFSFADQRFDCIIYGDVLEHLKEPWDCLNLHASMLSDSGVMLACIPNVQHWSTFMNLFKGDWPRASHGLFDRTHLRWFTRKSIISMFTDMGLSIYEIYPRVFAPEKAKALLSILKPSLMEMQIREDEFLKQISPLQYVVRAGKRDIRPLSIHGLSNINPPSMATVRLGIPFQALHSISGVSCNLSSDQFTISSSTSSDKVLIWQRPIFNDEPSFYKKIKALIDYGYLLIVEYDDDPSRHPMHMQSDFLTFRMSHAVQVSTPELAEQIKIYNPMVEVFPNNILTLHPKKNRDVSNGLKIFFGALNREQDWLPYMPALNEVLVNDPEFWSFSVVHDHEFYKQLQLPECRKSFIQLCNYDVYLQEMAACDIAFMPLRDTEFNRKKSDLKAVEAASLGLIPLASEVVYANSFVNHHTSALFSSPEELIHILGAWRQNPQIALGISHRARDFVGNSRLQCHQVARREAWYRELCGRRDELNYALCKRVPKLKGI